MVTEPQYLYWVLLFAFRCFCYFCSRKGKVASEPRRNYGLDGREYWTNDFGRPHMPLRFRKFHIYYYFYYKRFTNWWDNKCILCFLTIIINKHLNLFFFNCWHILVCNCSIHSKTVVQCFLLSSQSFSAFPLQTKATPW